jgi:hypothetical protein
MAVRSSGWTYGQVGFFHQHPRALPSLPRSMRQRRRRASARAASGLWPVRSASSV